MAQRNRAGMRGDNEAGSQLLDDNRGAHAYFQALQKDAEPYELTRKAISRYGYIAECARRRIDSDQLLREATPATRTKFLDMTGSIAGAVLGTRTPSESVDSYWCREALEDALDNYVRGLIRDRAEY